MIGELRSQEQTQNQGATVLPAIEIRIENLHKSFGTHRVLIDSAKSRLTR